MNIPTASWIIRNKITGEVVAETFNKHTADSINAVKYEAVPALEYLASLNKYNACTHNKHPLATYCTECDLAELE